MSASIIIVEECHVPALTGVDAAGGAGTRVNSQPLAFYEAGDLPPSYADATDTNGWFFL